MSETTNEIKLPSRLESVDEAATLATKAATGGGVPEDAMFAIDLAVREAAANAVKHGNKLDETKLVSLSFETTAQAFEITIRDEGEGFDFDNLPDPTDPQNLLKESGRGTFLMRNFMDEVRFSLHPEGGTIVKMIKNL